MDPFVKWLGRKDRIAKQIISFFPAPTESTMYYEPFLGSGAVAGVMAERFPVAFALNEGNPDLYWLYQHLVSAFEPLLNYIDSYFAKGPDAYYDLREQYRYVLQPGDVRRSALFIYFNRFGYNGLCRYNQSGLFNTPRGKHKTIYKPVDELTAWSRWLKTYPRVSVTCGDFANSIFGATKGDWIYMDPPYFPLSDTANFTSYGGAKWHDQKDHIRLANEAALAASSGATVVVSNHDVGFITEIYLARGAEIHTVPPMRRSVSSGEREYVSEILAVWR